jgi:hypothetical protein
MASKQQATIPNQQIVLQFTSDTVTPDDTQNTIALVKQQLQTAGVTDIRVQQLQDGELKITYFSHADIASIKEVLSQDHALALGYVSHDDQQGNTPSDDHTIDYDFDIYEIQQGNDISELDRKLALETKGEHDRFFNPNVLIAPEELAIDTKESSDKAAYKFRRTIAIAIDNNSYKIPEVRAGPLYKGIFDFS